MGGAKPRRFWLICNGGRLRGVAALCSGDLPAEVHVLIATPMKPPCAASKAAQAAAER